MQASAPDRPGQARPKQPLNLGRSARWVVSDAGPLIALGRLDLLHVLGLLFTQVQVPEVVIAECLARPGNPDTARIQAALDSGLLQSCAPPPVLLAGLEAGESAAITRALQIGAALLMDERAGRAHAEQLGLAVTGTLGVLVRARRRGLIGPLGPLVTRLRASGQRAQPCRRGTCAGPAGRGRMTAGLLPPLKPIPIKERMSVVFVERGEIDVLDGAFVVVDATGIRTHIPVGGLACIMLEPGTRLSHRAAALAARVGTLLVWVGEAGVRLYSAGPARRCAQRPAAVPGQAGAG